MKSQEPSRARTFAGSAARAAAVGLALGLFAWTLRDLDVRGALALLGSLGPLAALVLVPQAIGFLCHAGAWRALLRPLGSEAHTTQLYRLYLSAEAARMVAPAGAAVAESIAAVWLVRRHRTSWGAAVGSLALKKAWVVGTHGVWMLALLLFATDELATLRVWLPRGVEPAWLAGSMTIALLLSALVTLSLLSSRRVATAATAGLARAPVAAVRKWAEARRERTTGAVVVPSRSHAVAAALLAGQWATETFETWLILRLLGVEVSLPAALLMELGGSMVRSLAFMVPGGLGVQDASYVATLSALGVPGGTEVGAAFVVLKRLKDIVFILVGLTLLTLASKLNSSGSHSPDSLSLPSGGA
jgi:glycosyltransferase 2 family protein